MKTLVLGIGNPILSDDGAGIKVAQAVAKRVNDPKVRVHETSEAGFNLLDSIVGYDRVIIIDVVQTAEGKPGHIHRVGAGDFSYAKHFSSPHQMNLVTALELGKMLGLAMPQEITMFAVEAKDVTSFSEECTAEVEQAIPKVVDMVLQELAS